ncbi:hypothetical protein AURDEDRAFT_116222 [Auricularia subglabra TFB-10046 SS5]|nr:hypothetical protein AURDEDRAFT_116222 [Auricularia subglabra TFB-10046 SS5]
MHVVRLIGGLLLVSGTLGAVQLHWLDGKPPSTTPSGSAFGLPWAVGTFRKNDTVSATDSTGAFIPIQTWPLAFWPDGSLKWSGHALSTDGALSDSISVSPGQPAKHPTPVSVSQDASGITVSTGTFQAKFKRSGDTIIQSLSLAGVIKASSGQLVAHIQTGPDPELGQRAPPIVTLLGVVDNVSVEQRGPVRAVIKATGKYVGRGHAPFLPFTARFYVAAGATSVRLVHFFVYDGNQNADFIKGLGLTFSTPLSDAPYDRHVRFSSSDGGILGEAVLGLSGLRRDATAAVLGPQFAGTPVPDPSTWPTSVSATYASLPLWADWSLDQQGSERFTVRKRTDKGAKVIWLQAGEGRRWGGTGYVGGARSGGVSFALRDAWQRAWTGADVRGMSGNAAQVSIWAYSPRAPALDMRHYDTVAHGLDLTYEDVGNPDPDPSGIGRSYDLTVSVFSSTPSRQDLSARALANVNTPQLVADPAFYASHKLFGGRWSLPDASRAGAAAIEKAKSDLLDFYVQEIEQRKWYGFWDYGDVMHTYDQTRHVWRYDVGGYAWDNGELGTDLWLWTSFLRTGRADIFKLASALTRHLSEVDSHHTGSFAGLGSRHHVTHWGDGAKEARVASATLRRPYYYLTTDELVGDLMDTTLQADASIVRWEPLRKVPQAPPFTTPTRVRIGPDWTALAGNWFTRWERTLEDKWLEKIKVGMRDIGAFKFGLFTGFASAVGFDNVTGHMTDIGGEGGDSYHLTMIFGGGEFLMELVDVVKDVPEFDKAWIEFGQYYNAPNADKIARYGKSFNSGGFNNLYAKLQAYAGERLGNDSLKQAAWTVINQAGVGFGTNVTTVDIPNVLFPTREIVNMNTNDAASYSLSQYAILAIAPELAPQ